MFNALHKVFLTFEFVDKYPWVWPSISPHVIIRESKTVLHSGYYAMDWTLGTGFRIAIVGGIPNSLSLITDSESHDSGSHKQNLPDSELYKWQFLGFHKQKIPGYRNPYSPKWGDMKKKSYKVVLSWADFYHAVQGGSIILLWLWMIF